MSRHYSQFPSAERGSIATRLWCSLNATCLLITAFCLLSSAAASAQKFSYPNFPSQMRWGAYTVRAEHHAAGTGQFDREFDRLRITDSAGRTVRLIADVQITDIRQESLTGSAVPDLWVETRDGGNHSPTTFYAFRQNGGVSNILCVDSGPYLTVHDLAHNGKKQLEVSTEVEDADNGGTRIGRGPHLIQVFEWSGERFTVATPKFPALTKARQAKCKSEMLDCEKQEPGRTALDTSAQDFLVYQEIEATVGYLGNGFIVGDTGIKAWCEAHPFPEVFRWLQTHAVAVRKQITESAKPLPTSQKTSLGDKDLIQAKN